MMFENVVCGSCPPGLGRRVGLVPARLQNLKVKNSVDRQNEAGNKIVAKLNAFYSKRWK
jgi:hypothetical protein